jgi:predicted nucleotidyltransferase
MAAATSPAVLERLRSVACENDLRLLVLHGSRARNDATAGSDWDFGYLARGGNGKIDELGLRLSLSRAVGTDQIDLADLSRASGLLRYLVARDGLLVYESNAGIFDVFRVRAATFWCDVSRIVADEHDAILADLR